MDREIASAVRRGWVLLTLVAPATAKQPAHRKWYRLSLQRTLFGEHEVLREWGPLPPGPRPRHRADLCGSRAAANRHLADLVRQRLRRGYQIGPMRV